MRLFKKLRRKLDYLTPQQIDLIERAYILAFEAHEGQKRRSGEPYITHPVAAACVLADMQMDAQTIMAALLHDVIEDTSVDKQTIIDRFGMEVAELVDGVSKLTQIEFVSRAEAQAENFRKMVLAMSRDIRVILVKLADRLHNMRTLEGLASNKQQRIARETLDIFAPIAKRLGMREISVELEELSFAMLYPTRHRILKEAVKRARGDRKKILSLIEDTLHEGFVKSDLPSAMIAGREKHLYSIYRKMKHRHVPFNEIMDVYAFRIIVDSVENCYRSLGIVHQLFKPVPERFKDYIAIPKANGYQSLHTTLFGPYGLPIEVQIRTTEMDNMATSGIAAHWLYKSNANDIRESQLRAEQWVKNLLELQQRTGSSLEFIESVKVDLFPEEVYVFTPKGDIKSLPGGATVIDFAYAVHTDIGNHCMAAKVDRQAAPLSSSLVNGQTIEIITSPSGRPSPAWLDFAVTSKARSHIRHFLKSQQQSESIELGKQLLKKALSEHSLQMKKLSDDALQTLLKETKLASLDELYSEIGLGHRLPTVVAQQMVGLTEHSDEPVDEKPLLIQGTEGMLINFAECCQPLPGDPIVGLLDSGKGIRVHRETCQHIVKLRRYPDRCMPLRWAEHTLGTFKTTLQVFVVNERGVLAILALAIADAEADIDDIGVEDQDGGMHYIVNFTLHVKSRTHLARVAKQLRQIRQVRKLTRKGSA